MLKLDLEKAEEADQIASIRWIIEKARDFQKNIGFIDYAKASDCVGHNKLWKILFFSSTTLLLPTHLPPPSCTHAQSCNPMDCSPPGSSLHGLCQARILEWVAISFSKLWKILKEMGIPDHLNCLLRNLYACQEATVRTGHGTTDWFQTGKGVHQGCILSPCLFNFYAEYIMRNAGLEGAQAGVKIVGNEDHQEIPVTSDMQIALPLRQRGKRNYGASW